MHMIKRYVYADMYTDVYLLLPHILPSPDLYIMYTTMHLGLKH